MNRETHVRFCEGLGCNSLGLLTYVWKRAFWVAPLVVGWGRRMGYCGNA
jgi:hypothetical protein